MNENINFVSKNDLELEFDNKKENIFIYKSINKIMPETKFLNFIKNININESLNIQKISQKSFTDFDKNESESFQDLFRFINFFVEQENFNKTTIQIGPVFYMKNWEDSNFINMLEDNLNEEKEIIFYILDCEENSYIQYKNTEFILEKNYAIAIKYQNTNEINLKNFKNVKFICAWKRYA